MDDKFTLSIDSERFSNAEDENRIGNLLKHRSKGYGVLVNIRKLFNEKRRFKSKVDKMMIILKSKTCINRNYCELSVRLYDPKSHSFTTLDILQHPYDFILGFDFP